jgi:transposase InsO family protein
MGHFISTYVCRRYASIETENKALRKDYIELCKDYTKLCKEHNVYLRKEIAQLREEFEAFKRYVNL